MTRPDISVLIVNWRSGAMTRALIDNLRRQRFPSAQGGAGTLEFIVTDNASGPEEEAHLSALEKTPGVTLVRSAQNSGYAVGCNLACERATGEFVLITNPDVMAFRGALAALIGHLREAEGCGLAGPKGFLDAERFFQLPPVDLPSLCGLFSETLARSFRSAGQAHADSRSRRALAAWTAVAPVALTQISGFCFLMPAALARELGPFDPLFPFYYEDADLCHRLHKRGFSTDLVPRAQMVHFFNRSAGQAQEAALSRYAVSRRRFYGKRYGLPGRLAYGALTALTSGHGEGHHFAAIEDLGPCEHVPDVLVPDHGAYLAEISADPGFMFAAGRLDVSRNFRIPEAVWDGLVPATYYLRFLSRSSGTILRTVSLTKTGASVPITAELAGAGAHGA
ncbi:MAG TPA: glycosyltransferase [Planctomycetota bacterium]|nr:glycosyltransferase [Planctomycetota bacterium]